MIQSVFIYGLLIVALMLLGKVAARRENVSVNKEPSFFKPEILLALFLFSFVSGVRYDVGVDYLEYLDNYKMLSFDENMRLNIESGFLWITKFFAEKGIHFSIYFGFLAFVKLFFVYYAFRNERYLYPSLIFVIVTNGTYFTWMNGIRQSLVFCVFILMVTLIKERKVFAYLILLVLGYFIHKSSLLLIPILFLLLVKKDLFKNLWVQVVLLFVAVFLSSTNVWNYFMDYIDKAIEIFGYEDSYGDIKNKMSLWEQENRKGLRFYFPLLLYFIIAVFSKKLKSFYINTSIINFYNLYFLGALFSILFYQNVLLRRPAMYLIYMNIVISSYLLHYLYKSIRTNKRNLFIFILVVFLHLGIFYAYIASNFHTQYHFYWEI